MIPEVEDILDQYQRLADRDRKLFVPEALMDNSPNMTEKEVREEAILLGGLRRQGHFDLRTLHGAQDAIFLEQAIAAYLDGDRSLALKIIKISDDKGVGSFPYIRHAVMSFLLRPRRERSRSYKEKQYQKEIMDRFREVFPRFINPAPEEILEDGDRIDILAEESDTGRPVIIELKVGSKSGHKQLRSYAVYFKNPILIHVSEEVPQKKVMGVQYHTYKSLGVSLEEDE